MKKIYRKSQLHLIIGKQITGFDMHRYQLPYDGAVGSFQATNLDHVELMLLAVERYPELHVVTFFLDGSAVNRYEPKDAFVYRLHLGNNDPTIEFTREWSADDFTKEQWRRSRQLLKEFRTQPWTAEQVAAVNWAVQNISTVKTKI